jgi:SAM-dependent methyltransferase
MPEPRIPEADGVAEMVCFFSVFTHLVQEESFLYLQEAERVLKPGGRIIASYLDIADPSHWSIFEANVRSTRLRQEKPMDIFLSEDFLPPGRRDWISPWSIPAHPTAASVPAFCRNVRHGAREPRAGAPPKLELASHGSFPTVLTCTGWRDIGC